MDTSNTTGYIGNYGVNGCLNPQPTLLITYYQNMLDLIAISYKNIGPFENKLQTLFFDQGNYLIKAPIGSGKSFLFFDGPMYALYKYSTRNILNIKSKSGFIKLLFSCNDENYLIIRELKPGKSKDSCTSRLYKVNGNFDTLKNTNDISQQINFGIDIQEFILQNSKLSIEELSFKNETDVQQTLSTLLPEKEVFLSTVFLMQDAPNIFELQAAERLNVLKSVFGLLSIDNATEIISEKRKEIQTKIKVFSDTSSYDSKLKKLLNTYLVHYQTLPENKQTKMLFTNNDYINELSILGEKININEFETSNFPKNLSEEITKSINIQKEKYQKLSHELENFENTTQELKQQIQEFTKKELLLKNEIIELENKIKQIDEKKLGELKQKKLNLISTQNELNSRIDQNQIYNFFHKNGEIFDDLKITNSEEINLQITNNIIEKLKNKGVFFKSEQNTIQAKINTLLEQKKNIQNQMDDLKLEKGTSTYKLYQTEIDKFRQKLNNEISKGDTEILTLLDKQENYKESQKSLEEKIIQFEKSFDSQTIFNCEKIGTHCPFIQNINKKTFDELEKQKELLNQEKTGLENKIEKENLEEKIKQAKSNKEKIEQELKILETNPESFLTDFFKDGEEKKRELVKKMEDGKFDDTQKELEKNLENYEKSISKIKEFLEQINRKKIQSDYENLSGIIREEKLLDQEIFTLENETSKLETYKLNKEKTTSDLKNISEYIKTNSEKLSKLELDKKEIENQIKNFDYTSLQETEKTNNLMKENLRDIESLVEDYNKIKIKLKDLLEDEKIIKELHKVFSKELLLVVLQDSLPTLSEIINTFLSQVVNYQIKFQLNQTATQLELEAQIFDEKGERDVKSLSGGQRVVLKLVRMLAISSYLNAKILFLDETINNLDKSTVEKVAEMLSDFVKSKSIKLYTVTHSQHIQDMKIWDQVIKITN